MMEKNKSSIPFLIFGNRKEYGTINTIANFYNENNRVSEEKAYLNFEIKKIIETAYKYNFVGNLWKTYITFTLINDENPFSLSCEKENSEIFLYQTVLFDIKIIYELFFLDFKTLKDFFVLSENFTCGHNDKSSKTNIGKIASALSKELDKASSAKEFLDILKNFYKGHGVGSFGLNKAFYLDDSENGMEIKPISYFDQVKLSDMWGYEAQKRQLSENTGAFINGKTANNVLLFGDSGTGKSTSIKAILNEYSDRKLKIIEVYKHQFKHLTALIKILRQRNYYFIIYMDDLSFEDFEIEYKYLKAVIEGGLEPKPDNVLIYATSNRRHLIKETWKDRADMEGEVHHSDTLQEKLSLADRFGLSICFTKPIPDEYDKIVLHIAKMEGVNLSEDELLQKARTWSIRNGGNTGRAARQFINNLKISEL